MHAVLDSMINVIEPEMDRHIDRWGGSYDGWMANVDEIHDFIEERCAEMLINGLEDCYEVESVTLTLIIDGRGASEFGGHSSTCRWIDLLCWSSDGAQLKSRWARSSCFGRYWWGHHPERSHQLTGFTLNGDATWLLICYECRPQETTFVVDPPGAGEIYVDGTALLNYPATELLDYGAHDVQAVGLDQWHVFTGWSSTGPQGAVYGHAAGSISVTEPATYTASM